MQCTSKIQIDKIMMLINYSVKVTFQFAILVVYEDTAQRFDTRTHIMRQEPKSHHFSKVFVRFCVDKMMDVLSNGFEVVSFVSEVLRLCSVYIVLVWGLYIKFDFFFQF